jgi:NAD(P)-dependent dehydrogenase (short-subunit alcohol dehydrogenase family)
MTKPTVLITGATDGIGRETARAMLSRGYAVLLHGRTEAKAKAAAQSLSKEGEAVPVFGDLSVLAQVRALAQAVAAAAPTLDVLINNAGVFMEERVLTVDGQEQTLHVNHLAPALLTHLLLPELTRAAQGRVVNVSSVAHSRGHLDLKDLTFAKSFTGYGAYAASKLANVLFTHALARQVAGTAVTVNALHPGVITTKLLQKGFNASGASVESGARTSVYCATEPKLAKVTGAYFSDARLAACAPHANDVKLEEAFDGWTRKVLGL